MANKENKNVPISFRLTESEYEPYKKIMETTELTKTEFFRRIFLNQEYTFNVNERRPVEYDKLLFIFNKSGNNLNQIAHKLNSAYRGNVISEKVYIETLNNLISIERLLQGALNKC
ncbi:plasmid mobilization relaxosome protein MobC [Vibrio sinensis]|uniref:Plasmid mobilization relaxosome protein MobC n=1 Tax=Vibrio sinensis TaxID=2302434 RepID=A0A3A6QHD7_9VIBR|nr:plasmid mobilization relaxosome protein MobC [Vibrio sinensis]RJX65820.1 plasmid mobilization relaxosome protein MobC [Vibrio sinensis]